jgi:hypothetical protein
MPAILIVFIPQPMTNQTAEEIKEEHLKKMGDELGNTYNRIHNEIILIHLKWGEFEELYGTDEARIIEMNEIAPTFFSYLQNMLLEDVLLSISRITDVIKPRHGNERLTIQLLTKLVPVPLNGDISKLLKQLKEDAIFIRDWRDRKIAHFDKDLALNEHAEPLKKTSRKKVNNVLATTRELMNKIELHYLGSSTAYNKVYSKNGYELLLLAKMGLQYENLRHKFLKNGKIERADFTD